MVAGVTANQYRRVVACFRRGSRGHGAVYPGERLLSHARPVAAAYGRRFESTTNEGRALYAIVIAERVEPPVAFRIYKNESRNIDTAVAAALLRGDDGARQADDFVGTLSNGMCRPIKKVAAKSV